MKFQVFKDGDLVSDFELCGAYLFGTDGIAVRKAKIEFKNGLITCEKANFETAGLVLLWSIDSIGKIMLPTTCLPEREEPYILNVEIARARLMGIINKCEDWSYFNSQGDLFEDAKKLFIKAVQNISDAPLASKFADESLKKSMALGEALAVKQSLTIFNKRVKNHRFSKGCLGCNLDPALMGDERYVKNLVAVFGKVNIPINWANIERKHGEYDFSEIDACIKALDGRKITINAGPILKFSKETLPAWLIRKKPEFEAVRDSSYKFIVNLVSRYAGTVKSWRVVCGLNAYNYFGFGFEQILEMTRAANMAVKAESPKAKRIVEIANTWGEYYSAVANTIPPLVYIDMMVQSGINFDAFGIHMRFGKNLAGMHVRDLMQISASLDHFSMLGKPLVITEVEIPSEPDTDKESAPLSGLWHGQWSRRLQSQWIEHFYKIAFSKFFIDSVIYSHLADDNNSIITNSGLITQDMDIKESYQTLHNLRKIIFSKQAECETNSQTNE